MVWKKGRYSTCISKKTKLNKTNPTEGIYTAIISKPINIYRVQEAQGTETTPTQPGYDINVAVVMLYFVIPAPCACLESDQELPSPFKNKELISGVDPETQHI